MHCVKWKSSSAGTVVMFPQCFSLSNDEGKQDLILTELNVNKSNEMCERYLNRKHSQSLKESQWGGDVSLISDLWPGTHHIHSVIPLA